MLKAAIGAIIWSLAYLYIRRFLNPEIKDYRKYQTDAMYGGLAAFVANISKEWIYGML